jgi:hypothetical protein
MATYFLSPLSTIIQYFTDVGIVLNGGKINTYLAGSSTPTATYANNTDGTPNSNPIVLTPFGRLNNVLIWQPQGVAIKAIITDAVGNQIGPVFDNLAGINDVPTPAAFIFSASRTATQNLPASTKTTLVFDTASVNTSSFYNASTGIATVTVGATYLFTVSVLLQNNAVNPGTLNGVYISKNNADSGNGSVIYLSGQTFGTSLSGGGNGFANTASATLTLAANDTIRVKVDAGAGFGGGGQFNLLAASYFSGLRIPGT